MQEISKHNTANKVLGNVGTTMWNGQQLMKNLIQEEINSR
jgi:hypothetical protein